MRILKIEIFYAKKDLRSDLSVTKTFLVVKHFNMYDFFIDTT